MNEPYKRNHYVPVWYQKRFLPHGQGKFWYLDMKPERIERESAKWTRNDLLHWGPKKCFYEDDLYTIKLGPYSNKDIEKIFFGEVDSSGKKAVEFFEDFGIREGAHESFHNLIRYMTLQKLRTPKGIEFLKIITNSEYKPAILDSLIKLQSLYNAIWTECVWQIADASKSNIKLIISDNPVTVYNREIPPDSKIIKEYGDPDIRFVGTHTYFPLSLEKVLILTNLSWVRNPYQNAQKFRPNPKMLRNAVFNMTDVQLERHLCEVEVMEINYITKKCAFRYVASAMKEWLYPERQINCSHWRRLGNGYLFMPEPRHIHGGGEVIIGYRDGYSERFNEYGQRPWQDGYKDDRRDATERRAMERFQAEWSAMQGPYYRGVTLDYGRVVDERRYRVSDEYHQYELKRDQEFRSRPGERARRKRLMRLPPSSE